MGSQVLAGAVLCSMFASVSLADARDAAERETAAAQCPVHLEVEAGTALTPAQWRAVRDELERIWRPYGVHLAWASPSDATPGVFLRVVLDDAGSRQATRGSAAPGLGWVRFLDSKAPADEIRVSVAATRRLVERASFRLQPVALLPRSMIDGLMALALARVVAHELGHILLSTNGHAPKGLMRPAFPPDALVGSGAYFSLTAEQERQLKQVGHCRAVVASR